MLVGVVIAFALNVLLVFILSTFFPPHIFKFALALEHKFAASPAVLRPGRVEVRPLFSQIPFINLRSVVRTHACRQGFINAAKLQVY